MNNPYKKILSFILTLTLLLSLPCISTNAASKVSKVKSFTKTGASSTSIKLAWKKVSSVSGYQIQLKEDDEYYTIKTIKKADKTSYECQDLDAGQKYTFRIRAYKKTGSKKTYSKWTKLSASTKAKKSSSSSKSSSGGNGNTVYISGSGKKYHSTKSCSGLKHARSITETTKSKAESSGKTKCKLCY